MTGAGALNRAVAALRAAGIDNPARDARRLMAHALEIEPGRLTLCLPDEVDALKLASLDACVAARCARQPVSQIVGARAFYGRQFRVTPDVLDPRPETEILIECALAEPFDNVLDLGTGSGCILLTLLKETPGAWGLGSDLSEAALAVARQNRAALGLAGPAVLRRGDWYQALASERAGPFDLIVSNPPYISAAEMDDLPPELREWEPEMALTPGGDGLDAYRAITAGARAHLTRSGRLMVEIGAGQGEAVAALFQAAGLHNTRILPDLDGRDRVVAGNAPG